MYDFLLYGLLAPYDSPDRVQTLKNGLVYRKLSGRNDANP